MLISSVCGRVVRMKEKILKNWGFKILALLLGFVLWFLVANIEDYSITKTITGIPVEILNEQAILDQGMVYEIEQGETVDIKVEGRRSIVEKLTVDDFIATADLSTLSITNSAQINVDAVLGAIRREIDITVVDSMMKVAIEESGEKKLPITVMTMGSVQDGYAVVSATATPNMVTITGAASKVKDVATVKADIDVEGMNTGFSAREELILLDADGEVIKTDKIKTNIRTAAIKVDIKKTKEVPIEVSTTGSVAEGYGVAGDIEYQPTSVLIAGDTDILRTVSSIKIEDIDITDLTSDYEVTLDINNYLPDGIVVADQTQKIAVKVNIEKLVEKTILIRASNIIIDGKSDEFAYALTNEDNQFELVVVGLKADLDKLSASDFEPTVDVSDLRSEGTYKLTLSLKELTNVQYQADFKATIVLRKKDNTTENTEDSSSAEDETEASTTEN